MKSIWSYVSIYVRHLERERDELLNRLLEANQIRPLYDYGVEEGTLGAEAPKEPIQAYPAGPQRTLNELSRLSRVDHSEKLKEDAKRMFAEENKRREKAKANGGDNAPE